MTPNLKNNPDGRTNSASTEDATANLSIWLLSTAAGEPPK